LTTRKNHGFVFGDDRPTCKEVDSRYNVVVSYLYDSRNGLRMRTRRADVLFINYATSGRLPLPGTATVMLLRTL